MSRPPPLGILGMCVHICPDVEYIDHPGFNHCQPASPFNTSMTPNCGNEDGLLWALTTLSDDLEVCKDVFPCWDRRPA